MWTRRDALLSSALFVAPGALARENAKPGTTAWQLTNLRPTGSGGFRTALIEGYCRRQAYRPSDRLEICVSTNPVRRFTIDLYRMGYYGGAGARHLTQLGPFPGQTQPDPPLGENRLRECAWEPNVSFPLPADWPSGVYLGKLTALAESNLERDWQSYVIFVLEDTRRADILFQVSDNTWQAYNRWPDNFSLYTDPRHPWAPGVAASFDRPYGKYPQIFTEHALSMGSGEFLLWEYPLLYWLEQQGFDVTYTSNSSMLDASAFTRARVFLSVGHDEYWDPRQYDAALASVRAGVTHLYLSGNSVMGVTPLLPAADGRALRRLSREGVYGGLYGGFRDWLKLPFSREGPKANQLMGVHSIYPFNGGGDWICDHPRHWLFAGTGMKRGDAIPGLVGWEFHGDPADIPSLEIVARGTALSSGTRPVEWCSTIYSGPKRNFVFSASTIWWAQGLSSPPGHILPWSHFVRPHGPDPRVRRITRNLLDRALSGGSAGNR